MEVISAITWHDIQQLSTNLTEFTQFVQLMNWQNSKCKFVYKFAQSISKRITCILKFHNRKRLVKEESRPSPLQRRNFFLSSFRRFQNQNWNGAHHTAYVELCLHLSCFKFSGEYVFYQVWFLKQSVELNYIMNR